MQPVMLLISVDAIHPSPYQHRKDFSESKLYELAKSIERDGLIEPIVVRPNNDGYELIAGERRWRATRRTQHTNILARVVEATDLQARRMCAAENLQRQDLSAVEEVYAITELIDAELFDTLEYAESGGTPIDRVKWCLGKLDSDYKHETDHFGHKFMSKVESIFDSLPRPVEWRSFYNNDFRTITTITEEVKDIAIRNQLNKTQTKELDALRREAPAAFNELVRRADDEGRIYVSDTACNVAEPDESEEPRALRDVSAREMKQLRTPVTVNTQPQVVLLMAGEESPIILGENEGDEWYTPAIFIEAARKVMGAIDLDPATCADAQQVVQATNWYTKEDDGLVQPWHGRIWCNPPYSTALIQKFAAKVIAEDEVGRIEQAIVLVNNCTDTEWFISLAKRYPVMFSSRRARFWRPNLERFATRQGQAIFYVGPNTKQFYACFSHLAYAPIGK